MVKKRDIHPSRLEVAIDNMGVKVALRLNGGNNNHNNISSPEGAKAPLADQDLQSVQNSGASTNKAVDKSRRNKGMEKSVLDDIMGDPDDFGDLGDLDAGSDSDGGRWEDTFKTAVEAADGSHAVLPLNSIDVKVAGKASPDGTPKENTSMVDSSLTDCKQEPDVFEEPGSSGHKGYEKQYQKGVQAEVKRLSNVPMNATSSDEGKLHATRYFIIKSLSHRNIEMSIEKGIWATQVMNEPILEEAFHNSEKVILIFSVNMSGYFQGYAQMMSPVGCKRANVWSESNSGTNPWGRTFNVKWLRLHNLPFQKTVHLKNPLNEYKPVKISRDCQELTQEIGEALCSLIDEGSELDAKQKRKMTARDASHSKRLHRDYASTMADGKCMVGVTSQLNWPLTPLVYPCAQYPPVIPLEPYNLPGGMVSSIVPSHLEEPKDSRSRSPLASEKSNDRHRDRERSLGTDAKKERERSSGTDGKKERERSLGIDGKKERSRSRGNSRHGGDALAEEDLLHMVPAGWMTNGAEVPFPADQYANYLANWYHNQNPMMASNMYYGAQQMINTYPAIRHP
uniref:YTH domain-containing protein n=1 Tax=Araucaria cunninghamii TaxID=56994 RepID=A0A0D6R6M0_ARACU